MRHMFAKEIPGHADVGGRLVKEDKRRSCPYPGCRGHGVQVLWDDHINSVWECSTTLFDDPHGHKFVTPNRHSIYDRMYKFKGISRCQIL